MNNIKDLAIGNIVLFTQISNEIVIVDSIPNTESLQRTDDCRGNDKVIVSNTELSWKWVTNVENLLPIQLNQNVLENWLGFTLAEKGDRYGGWISPSIGPSGLKMRVHLKDEHCCFNMNNFSSVTIEGLHHLQNLHLQIYRHELKIVL